MDQRRLASVLFAVVGIFIAASRLPEIVVLIALVTQASTASRVLDDPASQRVVSVAGLIASLLAVLLGVTLVVMRDRLASRLFPAASHALQASELQAVALSVLGCYFAVVGLSRLVFVRQLEWSGVIQLGLGVGLFFGARGLARLWSSAGSSRT